MRFTFVTGFMRSGTTLLEKLLHQHPNVCIGSQPMPVLFIEVKRSFYKLLYASNASKDSQTLKMVLPLGPLVDEDYSKKKLYNFLNSYTIKKQFLQEIFDTLKGYSGHLTPEIVDYQNEIKEGTLLETYKALCSFLPQIYSKQNCYILGAKETICEEFIYYMLYKDIKVLHIIRDPRAVFRSAYYGQGKGYAGSRRPSLYFIRQWRKSALIALSFQKHPRYKLVKYENLVDNTAYVMNDLYKFLGISVLETSFFQKGITDQYGQLWSGNSSRREVKTGASYEVGGLPEIIEDYIESLCCFELQALGYSTKAQKPNEKVITSFKEPFKITRTDLPKNYSTINENITQEINRLHIIMNNLACKKSEQFFYSDKALSTLSKLARA